jgi:hypothetical protein
LAGEMVWPGGRNEVEGGDAAHQRGVVLQAAVRGPSNPPDIIDSKQNWIEINDYNGLDSDTL